MKYFYLFYPISESQYFFVETMRTPTTIATKNRRRTEERVTQLFYTVFRDAQVG